MHRITLLFLKPLRGGRGIVRIDLKAFIQTNLSAGFMIVYIGCITILVFCSGGDLAFCFISNTFQFDIKHKGIITDKILAQQSRNKKTPQSFRLSRLCKDNQQIIIEKVKNATSIW